jgi:hypothetical protein
MFLAITGMRCEGYGKSEAGASNEKGLMSISAENGMLGRLRCRIAGNADHAAWQAQAYRELFFRETP